MKNKLIFVLIIFFAFIVRLYRISNPVADWHSFRQADTASVTREYVKHGINLLEPKYHDLSNIQSGFDNLEGYRMVEFPFINGFLTLILNTFQKLDLVITSRLLSVLFSLGTLVCLYILVKKLSGEKTALLSALFFAFLPYSIYYSRAILPEPFMLFFSTLSLLYFYKFLSKHLISNYLISLISLSLALLLKPFVIFLAPVYLALWLTNKKNTIKSNLLVILLSILSLIPLYFWRQWIPNFPTGVPVSDWLLNGNGIRLRPAWFRWLFYERLTKMITGFTGIILLILNLFNLKKSRDLIVYASWWLGILIYFIVVASGNVQHDYYQVLIIPIVCISMARGLLILFNLIKKFNKNLSIISCLLVILSSCYLSWTQVKGFFNINHWEYITAGIAADKILPPDAKVIAPAMGDTVFLFQTNRTGWPIGFEIEDKIKLGAEYYINTSFDDETNELEKKYQTLLKTDEYIILDLTNPL